MGNDEKPARSAPGREIVDGSAVRSALGVEPGLCGTCRWARLVTSRTSTFLRCGASDSDRDLLRYPPLPVLECHAFVRRD